jgi:predicted phage terminase large subunit-like protein
MQNSPETESTRTFKDEWVNENTYDVLPEIKEVSAAIDPSLGKSRNSDTSAIIFLGRGVDNLFYILDASVRRRKPQELITDIEQLIRKWYKYNPMVTVETNVFQAFFATSLESYFVEHGIYVNWNEITHSGKDSKDQRILSLVPHIRNGHIKFPREGATRLRTQLRNWPRDHDDGPDCLEMALRPMLNINDSQFSFGSASIGVNNAKPMTPFAKAMDSIKSNFKFK